MEYTQLCNRSYLSILSRGKITGDTTLDDFLEKLDEEHQEVKYARAELLTAKTIEEKRISKRVLMDKIEDVKQVMTNMQMHLGYEPENETMRCIIKNEKRND